jgi:hypothetical protein
MNHRSGAAMSESGGRSLVLRAGDSGLVHDRRRPPHLADSPAPPTAEVALFEAAPGRVRARGCPTYPWYSVYASGVCRTLDSTLVALRLSDTDRDSLLLAVRLERMRCGAHPHLGIRAARRSGLDRSLDRRHLAFHYAPNPAFEDAAGDRSHELLRSTSTHILASVCLPSIGSSSIPQRAAEVPIGPANAKQRGASTAVTSWAR